MRSCHHQPHPEVKSATGTAQKTSHGDLGGSIHNNITISSWHSTGVIQLLSHSCQMEWRHVLIILCRPGAEHDTAVSYWEGGGGVDLEEWRHGNPAQQEISCDYYTTAPGATVESAQMGGYSMYYVVWLAMPTNHADHNEEDVLFTTTKDDRRTKGGRKDSIIIII